MKFSANLGFLFARETPNFVDRVSLAANCGFKGFEFGNPYDVSAEKLASAIRDSGVEMVLMNSWPGKVDSGELGFAIDPARCSEFRETLELSVNYLKVVDCKRLHILAGKLSPATKHISSEELERTYIANLRYAADRLQHDGILALIEPINLRSIPNYWLCDVDRAERIVREISHPNLRLQFDVFHVQILSGDLTRRIRDFMPLIGHVQIAQVPDRHEPDTPGEIDYRYVLGILEQLGYTGWVGLEYNPRGSTVGGLQWLKDWNYVK